MASEDPILAGLRAEAAQFLKPSAQESEILRGLSAPVSQNIGVSFNFPKSPADPVGATRDDDLMFLRSTWSAFGPESLGMSPGRDLERWRGENPGQALASELIGGGVALGAGAALGPAAALRIPIAGLRYAKMAAAAKALESPFLRGTATEVTRFLPFEALGVGGALLTEGADEAQEQFKHSLINLGAFGVFGGVGGVFRAGRPLPKSAVRPVAPKYSEELISQRFPEYDIGEQTQYKLRKLQSFVESELSAKEPDLRAAVQATAARLADSVLWEAPTPRAQAYVSKLAVGKSAQDLTRLFQPNTSKNAPFMVRIFRRGPRHGGFTKPEAYKEFADRSQLPAGFESAVQYYRTVEAATPQGSTTIRKLLERTLQKVDDTPKASTYIGREEESGIFVVARKLKGRVIEGRKGDLFDIFKTDQPGLFVPAAVKAAQHVARGAFALRARPRLSAAERSIPLARDITELKNIYWPERVKIFGAPVGQTVRKVAGLFKEGELKQEIIGAADSLRVGFKQIAAPTTGRFNESGRAQAIAQIVRAAISKSNTRAGVIFHGQRLKPKDANLVGKLFTKAELRGGIEPLIDALDERALMEFTEATVRRLTTQDAKLAGMSEQALDLIRKLEATDLDMVRQVVTTNKALGIENLVALPQHRMMSRLWRGGLRMKLHEDVDGVAGATIGYASGRNRKEVLAEALALQQKIAEEGKHKVMFFPDLIFGAGKEVDLKLAQEIVMDTQAAKALDRARVSLFNTRVREPYRFEERKGARGYVGELRPFTKKELKEAIFGNILESHRYMTENLLRRRFLDVEMASLARDYPAMAHETDRLINLGMGRKGEWAAALEKPINDKLAPIFGVNVAQRITRTMNQAQFALTLGALDLGFPALNSLTWVQTVLPEISLVLRAPNDDLARLYNWNFIRTQNGHQVFGTLDPMRIAIRSFKKIINADDEMRALFKVGVERQVVSPRLIEEFLGEAAEQATFRNVLSGKENFVTWLDAVSKFLPGRSEEFARLHSLSVGHTLGKDILQKEGEELFQFAKLFVERTMYNYAVMDRPAMLTGAFGSLLGLFKNWSFHYMTHLAQYTDQAFARGNWGPLLWASAGTTAIGGAIAAPLYGVANTLSRVLSDESLAQNLYDFAGYGNDDLGGIGSVGGKMVDGIMYGLPALFPGVALTARAEVPGADAVRDLSSITSVATYDRAQAIGRFLGTALDTWRTTGRHPAESKLVFDQFMRATMPRTVYRFHQSWGDKAIRSLGTGNKLVDDVSWLEALSFSAGVTPLRIQKMFDANSESWRDLESMRRKVSTVGEEMAGAIESGDDAGIDALLGRAMEMGLDPESVARSAQGNLRARTIPLDMRQFKSLADQRLREAMGLR